MAKHYGINGKTQVLKNLRNVMKTAGQKYSIRVGIIGEKASEKRSGTDLTNAQLGAVHEFGADIPVTDKMRAYLHYNGIHLKKETTHIKIPMRSFLRDTLLNNPQIKENILKSAGLYGDKDIDINLILNKITAGDTAIMDVIADKIGGEALKYVQEAFMSSGFGKWPLITEYTRQRRKNDKTSPPLQDGGDLLDSITVEVKKLG